MVGIVIGAAPIGDEVDKLKELVRDEETYIIAADGGISLCLREDIEPDMWIGDMDSAHHECTGEAKRKFPDLIIDTCSPIKDDTDTAIAIKMIFDKGCDVAHVFGGMGGDRPEHSIANVQLMHHYALEGKRVMMYECASEYVIFANEAVEYSEDEQGYISIFALTDSAKVTIEGLFYEYDGVLHNSYALGVSNEFCGTRSCITVSDGVCLVIRTKML